ncbi:hypothetical protein TorRG33x02_074930 [Trema orientale]|uniref:Uncharacterized protein n=1 Tax=Trema orientale TaxID=63057 RepID=A0A2P5FG74_TREOI|nr:hypothetical protein TorRG33x02_074930 [Trema orientale]
MAMTVSAGARGGEGFRMSEKDNWGREGKGEEIEKPLMEIELFSCPPSLNGKAVLSSEIKSILRPCT